MRNDKLLVLGIGLIVGFSASCSKRAENKGSPSAVANASTSDPEFDKKWAALAQAGADVAYIEDDRGEGLMGNVRRASRVKAEPPPVLTGPATAQAVADLPEQPAARKSSASSGAT